MVMINHKYRPEILVPYCAIDNNNELISKSPSEVTLIDNKAYKIKDIEYIHVLSDKAKEIIQRVYNMSTFDFMMIWYTHKNNSIYFTNMEFVHICFE